MGRVTDFVRGLFGVTFGIPGAETWEYSQQFVTGRDLTGGTTSGSLVEPYRQHAVLAKGIGQIAKDAASVDWIIHRRLSSGRVRDSPETRHPILDVWANPNPYMNGRQLWIGSYIAKQLFGEYFWYYPNLKVSRPSPGSAPRIEAILDASTRISNDAQIILLDPRRVVVKPAGDRILYYLRTAEGTDEKLDETKITHSKRWNPYNPIRGLSIVESMIADLAGDYAAAEWNRRFFDENNGLPSGLLMPGAGVKLDRPQRKDYLRMWGQKHGGTKRSVGILPGGWTFQDLGATQKDMDYRALREYSREIILSALGVPPFIAGVLDKANYANAREQRDVYWNHTIAAFLSDEADIINEDFFPKVGIDNYVVRPNWEKVKALLEDLTEKTAIAKTWFKELGLSKRVINERLDLGWDETLIPDYEIGYLPSSAIPVELLEDEREASRAAIAAAPTGPPVAPAEDDEDVPDEADEKALTPTQAHGRTFARRLRWKAIVGPQRPLEQEFRSKVRAHFSALRAEVLANLSGLKGFVLSTKEDEVPETFTLFDMNNADLKISTVTKPTYKKAVGRAGSSLVAEAGLGIAFSVNDPRVTALLLTLQKKIKTINLTLEKQLRETLSAGMQNQETISQLRDRVSHTFDVSLGRSRVIARTEVGAAYNGGRFEAMKQAGIERHEWLASHDDDVRESHADEDNSPPVKIGDPFPVTGLRYPQEPGGPPEEVINCRCSIVPVLEET